MADPGIDPRYAAQFQRGFDPAQHTPVERRGPLRIEVPRAVAHRVPEPPPLVDRAAAPRPSAGEHAAGLGATDEMDEFPAPRPRTEWALLAVGVLLPVLAVGVWWASVTDPRMFTGYTMSPMDQFMILAQNYLPGPMLVAGVVAIVAWVVLRAVGRSR